jgi:hypothetical protein
MACGFERGTCPVGCFSSEDVAWSRPSFIVPEGKGPKRRVGRNEGEPPLLGIDAGGVGDDGAAAHVAPRVEAGYFPGARSTSGSVRNPTCVRAVFCRTIRTSRRVSRCVLAASRSGALTRAQRGVVEDTAPFGVFSGWDAWLACNRIASGGALAMGGAPRRQQEQQQQRRKLLS